MSKPFFYTDDFMWDELGIHELPSVLHQYTSLDSLEKILENQSIRFSRLDTVNDPEEATAADLPDAATSVFVSCWTSAEDESIPMWSMYGDQFRGIRLSLPTNMFLGREQPMVFDKGGAKVIVGLDHSMLWNIERQPPAMGYAGRGLIGPNKVYYTNEPEYRNPKLIHRQADRVDCYTYDLGMAKTEHWSYEEEWRFKISWFPEEMNWPDDAYLRDVALNFKDYPITTEQVFVPLDQAATHEARVTKGPLMSSEDQARLDAILNKHAPEAAMQESEIPLRAKPGKQS